MTTDLSFITNENNQSLKDRFEVLIKDTSFFDYLIGYFYAIRNTQGRGIWQIILSVLFHEHVFNGLFSKREEGIT